MAKRKIFIDTCIDTSSVEHLRDKWDTVDIPLELIPPTITKVNFGPAVGGGAKMFDFAPWYGIGIDAVTYACQRQIERFLDNQDAEVSPVTIRSYCTPGISSFLQYLSILNTALARDLTLSDIHRNTIDGYIGFLIDKGNSKVTQKNSYTLMKAVIKALCARNLIDEIRTGDDSTFPRNPFPGIDKIKKGESPLPRAQRKAFSIAVKTAVMQIFSDEVEPTAELLAYALLIIALHTGRNTTPLLEMTEDCLRSHPKENLLFLVLYKRRSHSISKATIRADLKPSSEIVSMPAIQPTVARLVRRVIELSHRLRPYAPEYLNKRVWLYRKRTAGRKGGHVGDVTSLDDRTLAYAIKKLVAEYKLVDTDGKPLRINVNRLRKTFVNRIYEILDGDVATTATAAGDTIKVTTTSYLRPGENSQRNWKFMGMALAHELITDTIGATERTPVGRCSDNKNGNYAPKHNDATCMNFLNCLRCRNFVVTGDDLYRLFSFYWRIYDERFRMDPKRWQKQLAHIVRLIDRDVIEVGLLKGIFTEATVTQERERARSTPHPFWNNDAILVDLNSIAT